MLHGSENWVLHNKEYKKLNRTYINMLKGLINYRYKKDDNPITDEEVRIRAGVPTLASFLRRRRLRHLGHMIRVHQNEPRLPTMAMGGWLFALTNPLAILEPPTFLDRTARETWKSQAWKDLNRIKKMTKTDPATPAIILGMVENKAAWKEMCDEALQNKIPQEERCCPECSMHFETRHRMYAHYERRHMEHMMEAWDEEERVMEEERAAAGGIVIDTWEHEEMAREAEEEKVEEELYQAVMEEQRMEEEGRAETHRRQHLEQDALEGMVRLATLGSAAVRQMHRYLPIPSYIGVMHARLHVEAAEALLEMNETIEIVEI